MDTKQLRSLQEYTGWPKSQLKALKAMFVQLYH